MDFPQLISIQRAVKHADEETLRQFLLSMSGTQIRNLLSNYISHFTPYSPPSSNKQKNSPIDKIRRQRMKQDKSLFTLMKDVLVNNYFQNISNENPISINMINKKKIPGISRPVVEEAFPNLLKD